MRLRSALLGISLFVFSPPFGSGSQAGESSAPPLEAARDTLAKWVETQQAIAKEQLDWQEGKELLEGRIELLQREISGIETQIAATKQGIAEADAKRREIHADATALDSAGDLLRAVAADLEARTTALLKALPEPILGRIKPLVQRLPADPKTTTLTLGQRFQSLVGILNEINKFNREITVASELRALPDGTSAEVRSLYLGLAQAYYVTADGDAAGVGRPSPEGWVWTAANEIAGDVNRAIAILHNEQVPAFVPLPVEVQ